MTWKVEKRNGIYLPEIDWHLDARKPAPRAFISHAHFDHFGKHASILCSQGTAQLLQARMPGQRDWQTFDFDEPFEIEPGTNARLYPAGHIPGSAMLWLEREGKTFLYSGDFKLSPNLAAEACVVPQADTLLIETTYGIPRYTFPPASEVIQDIISFSRDTLENGETPILFGYSLGKAQEILKALSGAKLEIMVHPQVFKMTQACEKIGFDFPSYSEFDFPSHHSRVIISPPLAANSDWLSKIPNRKTAMISGWAIDPSAQYRNQADRSFPLSDHADFLDLQDFVEQVSPKIVYTTHGFAKEFAETLNDRGIAAWALGSQNQMGLGIPAVTRPKPKTTLSTHSPSTKTPSGDAILHFANTCEALSKTESRSKQAEIIAQYLSSLPATEIATASLFLAGQIFPRASRRNIRVDGKLNKQAILFASDSSEADFKDRKQENPDPQTALASLLSESQAGGRTLGHFRSTFALLEKGPNPVYQHSVLADEYRKLAPVEGKYLSRLIAGALKTNVTESIIEEALALRFNCPLDTVRQANFRCSDLERIANAALDNMLEYIPIQLFFPLSLVTSSRGQIDLEYLSTLEAPLWVEDLYDGFRCQIHKLDERVEMYDAQGNSITHKFPEITEAATLIPQDFIADGTLVAWEKEAPLPYSKLCERLERPAAELLLSDEADTLLWLHDLLWNNGDTLVDQPLSERKSRLYSFSVNPKLRISPVTHLDSIDQIHGQLQDSQKRGNQGLIIKKETSPYNPLSDSKSGWISFK